MKNIFLRKISGSFAVLFFLVTVTIPAPILAATKGGVNPGNTFYAFDIFFEKVDLAFTFNKEKRVQKIIANTEERLAEAEEAVVEDKPDIAEKAIAKYQEGISSAVLEAKGIDDKEKSKRALSDIGDNISKHQDVLTSVYNSALEASKESVGKAIAISVAEKEKIKEELAQVIVSPQVDEESVKAQNEAEKIIVVENQGKNEIENKKKQESNTNVSNDIASKPVSVSSKNSGRGGGGSGGVAMSGPHPVNPTTPATPATPATGNNLAIPATPAIPANPSWQSSSSFSSVSSFSSSSSVYSSSSVSSSSSSIATSSSSSSVATSSSSAISSASPIANDNLGPWITNLSILPTSINPGGLVTFTVTAEDLNGIGSIVVDIKYPNSNYYLRPNFNFSGATSGTQTFTETIDHGISPTILGDYTILTIRAVDSLGNLSTYYPGGTVTGAKQGTHTLTIPVINVSEPVQSSSSSVSSSSSSASSISSSSSSSLSVPQFILKWGTLGTDNGQFNRPVGVAVDSNGNIYVVDSGGHNSSGNYRIQKFDASGNFISKWGNAGTGNGLLTGAKGIAIDTNDNVYVGTLSEYGVEHIQKFDSSGNFITRIGDPMTGLRSLMGGATFFDIAVGGNGNIYVADAGVNKILKYNSSGALLLEWGSSGGGDGQFNTPRGIAIDTEGNIYVADSYNSRMQKFDSSGNFLMKWGVNGFGDGQFTQVFGVYIDTAGYVYVTSRGDGNESVQKFSNEGSFVFKIGNSIGSNDGQFSNLEGIAVDMHGNIYVADKNNARIQKFAQ